MNGQQENQGQTQGQTQQTQSSETTSQGAAGQQSQQSTQTQSTSSASPGVGLTPEQLQSLVRGAVSEVTQRQETAEEQIARFKKAFNVYEFQPERLKTLGYAEEQLPQVTPFYESLRDGLVKQALTMSQYHIQQVRDEILGQLQPVMQVVRQQEEQRLKQEFLETYKDLKGYEPLLEEIKDKMLGQNVQFKSKEELFNAIATHARGLIAKITQQQGGAGNGQGGQQQQQQQTHRMSTVTTGGQGGVGSAATSGGEKPGWLAALS